MSNKPIGPCATCGRPTTDQRTCPGCQKTLYLHVFCGVADHAKVIWCRLCAAKDQSLNKAGPSSDTIIRKQAEGPCVSCGAATRNQIICPGCRNPLFLHGACGVPDHSNQLWCRPCATAKIPAPSNKPTLFTTIARTHGPFTQSKKGTRKSQSLLPFTPTKKRSYSPTHQQKPVHLQHLLLSLLLLSRRYV